MRLLIDYVPVNQMMFAWKQFVILMSTLTVACIAVATELDVTEYGPTLIGCDRANTQVTIDASAQLDPSCTWTRGFKITASDVLFDCQGAHIVSGNHRYGIHITAPADKALSNITVRNCHVEGFLNNIRVTRAGFRKLTEGREYDHAYTNIVIENS
ncbi:MAG: hypothetical protein HW386_1588, partial [Gammaproteobacteria bacterium]|nr:hypothetical protein [Gammaproteobacteria bacterium]